MPLEPPNAPREPVAEDRWWERLRAAPASTTPLPATPRPRSSEPRALETQRDLQTILREHREQGQELDQAETQAIQHWREQMNALQALAEYHGVGDQTNYDVRRQAQEGDAAREEGASRRAGQRFGPIDFTGFTDADYGAASRAAPAWFAEVLNSLGRWADENIPVDSPGLERRYAPTQPRYTPDDIRAMREGNPVVNSEEIVVEGDPTAQQRLQGIASQVREALAPILTPYIAPRAGPGPSVGIDIPTMAADLWREPARRSEGQAQLRDQLRAEASVLEQNGDTDRAALVRDMADRASLEALLPFALDYPSIITAPEFAFPGLSARLGTMGGRAISGARGALGEVGIASLTPEQLAILRSVEAAPIEVRAPATEPAAPWNAPRTPPSPEPVVQRPLEGEVIPPNREIAPASPRALGGEFGRMIDTDVPQARRDIRAILERTGGYDPVAPATETGDRADILRFTDALSNFSRQMREVNAQKTASLGADMRATAADIRDYLARQRQQAPTGGEPPPFDQTLNAGIPPTRGGGEGEPLLNQGMNWLRRVVSGEAQQTPLRRAMAEGGTDWRSITLHRGGEGEPSGLVFLTPDERIASVYGPTRAYQVRGNVYDASDDLIRSQDDFNYVIGQAREAGADVVVVRALDRGKLGAQEQVIVLNPRAMRPAQEAGDAAAAPTLDLAALEQRLQQGARADAPDGGARGGGLAPIVERLRAARTSSELGEILDSLPAADIRDVAPLYLGSPRQYSNTAYAREAIRDRYVRDAGLAAKVEAADGPQPPTAGPLTPEDAARSITAPRNTLTAGVDPTRRTAQQTDPRNNAAPEPSATEAGTDAPSPMNIPADPAEWRTLIGQHPWINSPSRAQLVIMANARQPNGALRYSHADIANATGYDVTSVPVFVSTARKAGVPLAMRNQSRGMSRPGGERSLKLVETLERYATAGERPNATKLAEQLGTTPGHINVLLYQIRRGVRGDPDLQARLRALEARAGPGGDLSQLLPWLATGGYLTAVNTVGQQGYEEPEFGAAQRFIRTQQSEARQ